MKWLTTQVTISLVVAIWLLSFVASLGMSLWGQHETTPTPPQVTVAGDGDKGLSAAESRAADDKKLLQKQPWDTFGPQLAVMLAFLFGTKAVADMRMRGDTPTEKPTANMQNGFALAVSVLYCALFVALMAYYAYGKWTAQGTVEAFSTARPYCSAIVTGMMTLYFGKST